MTATAASPDARPQQLTADLLDDAIRVYKAAQDEARALLSVDDDEPVDRYAMMSLLVWIGGQGG